MAHVFLSYDREDEPQARAIAQALEKAGHSVWWDRHIKGGAQYSKEIEQALKAADAVIVLWSEHSVESAWVRDEAAAARDGGKFVPATIDGTPAPLGFRQFQTIDLQDWKRGSKAARFKDLLAAADALAREPPTAAGAKPQSASKPRRLPAWAAAAALAVALLATGLFAWTWLGRSSSVPVVAVAAADSSSKSQALASDLLVKLGSLQTANLDPMRLVDQREAGSRAALLLKVGDSSSAGQPEATVALFDGSDRSLLWSKDFGEALEKPADFEQQVAYTTAQVLRCALEGSSAVGRGLDQQGLKLYLQACAGYADKTSATLRTLIPMFLQLIRRAPEFAGGWAKLLRIESEYARMIYLPDAAGILAQLPTHIAGARRLDPNMPEAFVAEAALLPDIAFERRIGLLERAVKVGPNNPAALSVLSDNLLLVGRMNEAVDHAQRVVQADPLSPTARDSLVGALTYAGKIDVALAELDKAEKLWPGASSVVTARFRIHLRYGDPNEALRLVRTGQIPASNTPFIDSFLQARARPTQANIDQAIGDARSFYERQPTVIYHLAQVLGTFGRNEELIAILLNWRHPEKVTYVADALFRPALGGVQRDPRMIPIAQRLGLLDYWQRTGHWPDFCFEPGLPYDCKAEAAKFN